MIRTLVRGLVAALAGCVVVGAAGPAWAAEPPLPSVILTSPLSDPVTGSFSIEADVDLAGADSVTLSPVLTGDRLSRWTGPDVTVTAADCPTTCHYRWDIDTTSWGKGLAAQVMTAVVYWSIPNVTSSYTFSRFFYDPPVEHTWISETVRDVIPGYEPYLPAVFHTGGTVTSLSEQVRGEDEVLDVRLYTDSETETGGALVRQVTGTWETIPDADGRYHGSARLDTSTLPEGRYLLFMRSRNAAGQWGQSAGSVLFVRHSPAVTIEAASPALTAGAPIYVEARINRPLRNDQRWSALRVTVDAGTPQVLSSDVVFWNVPPDDWQPVTGSAALPTRLPEGTHSVTVEVLDPKGNRIGSPGTSTVRVVAFNDTITVPALVVGQASTVVMQGTAPSGITYRSCLASLFEGSTLMKMADGCMFGETSYRRTTTWTPQAAGPAKVEYSVSADHELFMPSRTTAATIYARRTPTLSAPTSSGYGAKLTATVSVRDLTKVGSAPVARAGVAVALQRKVAGTAAWATISTGKTNAAGQALISFTNTASGRLRAVVTSAVPGATVTTSERAVTSVATVSWTSLTATVRSGVTGYAAAYGKPYEKGAVLRVQARRVGGTWVWVGSAKAVSTTGWAKPAFRLVSRGTWEVRVVRLATTQRAAGYSTARRVLVL